MGTLLKVVGAIWALIGLRNLFAMFWTDSSQGILTFGLLFNILLFVLPGLVAYGMGVRIKKKQSASADVATSNATATLSETSVGEQLSKPDSLKEKRDIGPSGGTGFRSGAHPGGDPAYRANGWIAACLIAAPNDGGRLALQRVAVHRFPWTRHKKFVNRNVITAPRGKNLTTLEPIMSHES